MSIRCPSFRPDASSGSASPTQGEGSGTPGAHRAFARYTVDARLTRLIDEAIIIPRAIRSLRAGHLTSPPAIPPARVIAWDLEERLPDGGSGVLSSREQTMESDADVGWQLPREGAEDASGSGRIRRESTGSERSRDFTVPLSPSRRGGTWEEDAVPPPRRGCCVIS